MKKLIAAITATVMLLMVLSGCSLLETTTTSNNARYEAHIEVLNNASGIKKLTLKWYATPEDVTAGNPVGQEEMSHSDGTALTVGELLSFQLNVSDLDNTGYEDPMTYDVFMDFITGKDNKYNYKQVWSYYLQFTITDMDKQVTTLPSFGPVELRLGRKTNMTINPPVSGSDIQIVLG